MSSYDFKSKYEDHALQRDEKISIMFDLICMMAEKSDKVKFKKIKEEWNKNGEYRS